MIGIYILMNSGFVAQVKVKTVSNFIAEYIHGSSWFQPSRAYPLVQLVQEHEAMSASFRFQHDFRFGAKFNWEFMSLNVYPSLIDNRSKIFGQFMHRFTNQGYLIS